MGRKLTSACSHLKRDLTDFSAHAIEDHVRTGSARDDDDTFGPVRLRVVDQFVRLQLSGEIELFFAAGGGDDSCTRPFSV